MTEKDLLVLEGTVKILIHLASVIDDRKAKQLTLEYATEIMRIKAEQSTKG